MEISVVSPCYGAPTLLKQLVEQITETVSQLTDSYEIILVEDCSPDNSREIIRDICANDPHVKGVFLSRNFGQQSALNAGYDVAQGNYVVTLDCDLQNPPSQIRNLYMKAKEGYDIVYATRQNRPDTYFMTKGSQVFNSLMGFLTDTQQDEAVAEFAIFSHKVIDAMAQMGDYRRYYPLMTQWVGFKTAKVDVEHAVRTDGKKSSYSKDCESGRGACSKDRWKKVVVLDKETYRTGSKHSRKFLYKVVATHCIFRHAYYPAGYNCCNRTCSQDHVYG